VELDSPLQTEWAPWVRIDCAPRCPDLQAHRRISPDRPERGTGPPLCQVSDSDQGHCRPAV